MREDAQYQFQLGTCFFLVVNQSLQKNNSLAHSSATTDCSLWYKYYKCACHTQDTPRKHTHALSLQLSHSPTKMKEYAHNALGKICKDVYTCVCIYTNVAIYTYIHTHCQSCVCQHEEKETQGTLLTRLRFLRTRKHRLTHVEVHHTKYKTLQKIYIHTDNLSPHPTSNHTSWLEIKSQDNLSISLIRIYM